VILGCIGIKVGAAVPAQVAGLSQLIRPIGVKPADLTHPKNGAFHIAFLLIARVYYRADGPFLLSHCFFDFNHADGP
jgi:hypothetical protein